MGYFNSKDVHIVRELAARYYEIANSDENKRSIELAYNANDLKGGRPFVEIDEVPWNEFYSMNELKTICEDPFARSMEGFFRKELFRKKYFPTNHIHLDAFYITKSFEKKGWDMEVEEKIIATDKENNIVAHEFSDILPDEAALEKMHPITVIPHPETDAEKMEMAGELLNGVMPVKLRGVSYICITPWDEIVRYHTVENTYIDLLDRPEFMLATVNRYNDIYLNYFNQLQELGLLDTCMHSTSLHCTAPYTSALPQKEDGERYMMRDLWLRCTAQAFCSCSPETYRDFELEPMEKVMSHFGLVYYGCCEPLERVIPYLKKYPNIRKIGVSPFANLVLSAEQIGGDYCLARKPDPAHMVGDFSEEIIKNELIETIRTCEKYGCSYDYVLKDISTVCGDLNRLTKWSSTVNGILDAYYGK